MRFALIVCALIISGMTTVPASADREERAQAAFQYARQVVETYKGKSDPELLFAADRQIERAWSDLMYFYGLENELARDLALIRARSATSRKDRSRVAEAWQTALQLQPRNLPTTRRMALNIMAANATGSVGDVDASMRYFAAARTYAFSNDREAKMLQLQLRLQELRLNGQQMEWRRLRDSILDMRKFSEGFSMWTVPRLDALLGEAEIRIMFQPEEDDKRTDLSDLKSKIVLMMKGIGDRLPPAYVDRIRTFYYTLEDNYDL